MLTEHFRTSDLVFAAVLMEKGFEVKETTPSDRPGKVLFAFQADDKIEELKSKYMMGKVKVEPTSFQNSLRHLKTIAER